MRSLTDLVAQRLADDVVLALREALKFYADEKNHRGYGWQRSPVETDGGKIAREALEPKR